MFSQQPKIENQRLNHPVFDRYGFEVHVKREDLIHPQISGNKYRKLKYNLSEAQSQNHHTLLTFGGAYSNHLAATAAAGKKMGFKTIGLVRGEELSAKFWQNPTLAYCASQNMQLEFISRQSYRLKHTSEWLENIDNRYGRVYVLPEGGTNALAVKGCEEILTPQDAFFDVICCPVGTGGTLAGLINSSSPHQHVIGFSALKGTDIQEEIRKFASNNRWSLESDDRFGGYAKINSILVTFINQYFDQTAILWDPIYTAKMVFGLIEKMKTNQWKHGKKILLIHTGGLQSISGMNQWLRQKGWPSIHQPV